MESAKCDFLPLCVCVVPKVLQQIEVYLDMGVLKPNSGRWWMEDPRSIRESTYPIQVKSAKTRGGPWRGPQEIKGWSKFTFLYICWLSTWFMRNVTLYSRGYSHIGHWVFTENRKLSLTPWGAPCNDVQMVAARCPMIRLKNYTDRKNIAFHLTLLSSCLDPVLHDIALFGSEFPNYFSTKLSCTFHKQNLWKFLGFICWKVSM